MSNTIEYYTQATLTDDAICARTAHFNRMLAEELPSDPPYLVEDALKRMRNLPSTSRNQVWNLRYRGRIAAQASLGWAELDTNKRACWTDITVERGLRRRGLGSELLALVVGKARQARRPRIFSHSSARVPAGRHFLAHFGFKQGLENHVNQLVLARLDHALMARWLAMGRERAGNYVVELWDGPVPEESLSAFAELANVMNSEPRGTLDIEDTKTTPKMIREGETFLFANASRRFIACARHVPSGVLAGFTELAWNPKRSAIVWQHGTAVVESHRNKGLGRWLKAANMDALLSANREARFVRTGNADSNAPMLAINRQMGFEPFIATIAWQGWAPAVAKRMAADAPPARRRVA